MPLQPSARRGAASPQGAASLGEGHTVVGSYSSDLSEVVCLALWHRDVLQPHFHVLGFSQWFCVHKQLVAVLERRDKFGFCLVFCVHRVCILQANLSFMTFCFIHDILWK